MTPDSRSRRRMSKRAKALPKSVQTVPSSDDAHKIVYFKSGSLNAAPGRDFLNGCPTKVRATMRAVLTAVAAAPPKRFAGGGYWEAMKGHMTGWFEIRVDGPRREHFRLFCLLDYEAQDDEGPLLVVVTGLAKPFRTTIADSDYELVRLLGQEYLASNPRQTA